VAAQAAAPAESATGMWAVQLGSFSDQANAERLAADLRSQGYAAFLSRLQTSANLLHRVRVGPQESRESAENIAAQLQKNGHKGQVVPHP
jgi:DedD protein